MLERLLLYVCVAVPLVAAAKLTCGQTPIEDPPLHDRTKRVAGGHPAAEGNWPWAVNVDGCTGAIIGKRYVMTAAHCAMKRCGGCPKEGDPLDPYTMKVFAGSVDVRKATPYNVSRVSLPDNWKQPKGRGDDIALLEVDREFEFTDYVQPICIPTKFTERPGNLAYFVGWGGINKGPDPPVNATDWESTYIAYENIMPFRGRCGHGGEINPQNYFCAGQNMRTIHNGDSGGPLMINRKGTWFQVGVCHGGWGTNIHFARASSQCKWIEKETNGEVVCSDLP